MVRILALTAIAITACGGIDLRGTVYRVDGACLGPYIVHDGVGQLLPDSVLRNEQHLKALFTAPWSDSYGDHPALYDSEAIFCGAARGIPIVFDWGKEFACDIASYGDECSGLFIQGQGIELGYGGTSLAHELLHLYDVNHGFDPTAEHPRWDKRGFLSLAAAYWEQGAFQPMIGPRGEVSP